MTKITTGQCTPGCGECCRLLILPMHPKGHIIMDKVSIQWTLPENFASEPAAIEFRRCRGVTLRWDPQHMTNWATVSYDQEAPFPVSIGCYDGKQSVFIQTTCPLLKADGKCSTHDHKPYLCVNWPTPRDDLSMLPHCTYRIVEVGDAELSHVSA